VRLLRATAELADIAGPLHLAIGVFDGVHLGHRAVIECAVDSANASGGSAVVITFDPHPASVLRPEQAPALLTSSRHKLRLIAALGVTHALVVPFDVAFASTAPADFVISLASACRPLKQICVGENWAFGKGRSGDVNLLRLLGQAMRFEAVGVPSVAIDGAIVSSTAIRGAIQAGELATAAAMLGRHFSVFGTVQPGRQLARQFGFPTANVRPECEQLPPDGVYVVDVDLDGEIHAGIANVGLRPTVEENARERLVEVHLFDWHGELGGRDLEIAFLEFLRPEQKFPSLDALRAQIDADAAQARAIITARAGSA
jgi:riboflavin kinase / FMN adenylyltransferase